MRSLAGLNVRGLRVSQLLHPANLDGLETFSMGAKPRFEGAFTRLIAHPCGGIARRRGVA
jgi:hypothetical protein